MHARVATFQGGNPEEIRRMVEEINQRSESGPPEGVPATGLLILHNSEGKAQAITLFESEEDLRQGRDPERNGPAAAQWHGRARFRRVLRGRGQAGSLSGRPLNEWTRADVPRDSQGLLGAEPPMP